LWTNTSVSDSSSSATFIGTVDSGQSTGDYIPLTLQYLYREFYTPQRDLLPPVYFAAPVIFTAPAATAALTVPVTLINPAVFVTPAVPAGAVTTLASL